ncbi:MAG TPA: efflux transporter outer membrane subunit [Bryobacteraceae bacterium]|nr:efflux transporter outer membrane subunit [Bryobacteraceae bacterium]
MNLISNTNHPGTYRALVLTGVLLVSNACMVGPKYQRPTAPAPTAYKEPPPSGWKEAQPSDGAIRGKWWEIYNDAQLNSLEEQVSISNQNVRLAEAQFQEAKAAVRIARSALFPTVSAAPSIISTRTPSQVVGSVQGGTKVSPHGFYSLPLDASYTADLWGSIRRSIAASTANAQVSAADLENAKLTFQAELASDYFQLHGLDGDAALLADAVRSYAEFLTLTRNRYAGGVASLGDVAQAETQLETTRGQLVEVGVQRAQFEHAIAILIGKPPSEFSISVATLTTPPPAIPIGVPSTLLERRPDIAANERQVAAANEQIGIAKAAFYPTLTLSGSAGLESADFLKWLTWPSRFWSVGPQLAETLFDAGKRHAQVSQAEAAYDATVDTYRQTVLTALQQVEDNLSALRILAEEAEVTDRAVKAARQSLDISTDQYRGGIVAYLQVITAQTAWLTEQRVAVDLLTRRMTTSVSLIQALGGGWDASQLPKSADIMAANK